MAQFTEADIGMSVSVPPSAQKVDRVYANARAAFPAWRTLTVEARLSYFRKLRLLIVERMDEIADVIAKETGKVPFEALATEVMPVLESLRHLEKHARGSLAPRKVRTPLLFAGKRSYVSYQPRGVVVVISPWNFPLQLSMIPVLSAAVAGNSVILKPSEFTPKTGQLMADLFRAAGWPDGVVQVVLGDKAQGAALVDASPDYIFFTGSERTGRLVQTAAAARLIPTTLELGGKDPMIVFADAPLDRAVHAALWGGLLNSGQVCMSVERVYVERPIYPRFVERLVAEAAHLRQGLSTDDDVGRMTTEMQVEIVRDHVRDALTQGAKLEAGHAPEQWSVETDRTIAPMVLTGVTHEMKLMREETFGPVLPVMPFDTEEEAIAFANAGNYGLSASVWSRDVARGQRVAGQLVSGNVLVNDVVITISNQNLPFGGEKASGLGRYHGVDGIRNFCIQTSTMVDSGKRLREVAWFPYRGKYPEFTALLRSYYGDSRRWIAFIRHYLRLFKMSK
jgi:acyl-CoA reductase-like NAD-dependent aldehyde dehydrogenase